METIKSRSYGAWLLAGIGIFLLIPLRGYSATEKNGWRWVDAALVQTMLREGSALWLIDVRSPAAYESEHIEGSVNILPLSLKSKKFSLRKKLVLIDDSIDQKNAKDAADMLFQEGNENVYVLAGGIALWARDGYPVVSKGSPVRGVTVQELRRALENNALLKIYDMRGVAGKEENKIQGSEGIPGKNMNERIENLKTRLIKNKSEDLAGKLGKTQIIVLVFAASEDPEYYTRRISREIRDDIRYLIGGYETFASGRFKVSGMKTCPTCPGGKR